MWAEVKDGKIKKMHGQLPKSLGKVSGFHRLSTHDLKKHGFLPVEIHHPNIDENFESVVSKETIIKDDKVIIQHIVEKNDEKLLEMREKGRKNNFFKKVIKVLSALKIYQEDDIQDFLSKSQKDFISETKKYTGSLLKKNKNTSREDEKKLDVYLSKLENFNLNKDGELDA